VDWLSKQSTCKTAPRIWRGGGSMHWKVEKSIHQNTEIWKMLVVLDPPAPMVAPPLSTGLFWALFSISHMWNAQNRPEYRPILSIIHYFTYVKIWNSFDFGNKRMKRRSEIQSAWQCSSSWTADNNVVQHFSYNIGLHTVDRYNVSHTTRKK